LLKNVDLEVEIVNDTTNMDKGAKWEAPMIEERCKHLRTAISD
jgi:hypothetical protein